MTTKPPDVPYCGPLYHGKANKAVSDYKRSISRAMPHVYKWTTFTDYYGDAFFKAVKNFQRDHGMEATGNIGRQTHEALERTHAVEKKGEWAFDAVAIKNLTAFSKPPPKPTEKELLRAKVQEGLNYARYLVQQGGRIWYAQVRPMPLLHPNDLPARTDCSGSCTLLYYAADLPDPNGRHFDGLGYTGTLVGQGTRVTGKLQAFDLQFYGSTPSWRSSAAFPTGSPTHVGLVLDDTDYIFTFGSEPGPCIKSRHYRTDLHSTRRYIGAL